MLHEFRLARTGETASADVLEAKHLAQVLALQEDARAGLPPAQKMFVLPQPRAYFEQLLDRQGGLLLGIRVRGQMIAQMAVLGSLTLDAALTANTFTRNLVTIHHAEPSDLIVALKSMAVHPDWRGNDISQHMLATALELPVARTADHVFAQVSAANDRSWGLFLRQGFGVVAAAVDATDMQPRFVLQKPALGFAIHRESSAEDIGPLTDFATIMRLTEREALVGQIDDIDPKRLAFHASRDLAASWNEAPYGFAREG